ncbi:peptidoglycan-binding protein, partial [Streptomyces sp. SID7982]|nr:peptidoglycan-binding protein [Streptomyces sp. SID7982]
MRSRPIGFLVSTLAGAALAFGGTTASASPSAAPAPDSASAVTARAADGCYTWSGTLREGSSGEAVRQLQIRVAGYPGTGNQIAIDGAFGPATKAAVSRFQAAYG